MAIFAAQMIFESAFIGRREYRPTFPRQLLSHSVLKDFRRCTCTRCRASQNLCSKRSSVQTVESLPGAISWRTSHTLCYADFINSHSIWNFSYLQSFCSSVCQWHRWCKSQGWGIWGTRLFRCFFGPWSSGPGRLSELAAMNQYNLFSARLLSNCIRHTDTYFDHIVFPASPNFWGNLRESLGFSLLESVVSSCNCH